MSAAAVDLPRAGTRAFTPLIQRLLMVLVALIYARAMNWSYEHVESYVWEYRGFVFSPPPTVYIVLGYLLTALGALLLPTSLQRPSDLAFAVLYGVVLVPIAFLPFHWVTNPADIAPLVVTIACCFAALGILLPQRPFTVGTLNAPRSLVEWILLLGTAGMTLYVLQLQGFSLTLSLDEDYARRLSARDIVPDGSARAYVISWLGGAFAPLAVAIGIERRKRALVLTGAAALISLFSLTGAKQFVVLTPMLLALSYSIRGNRWISPALILLTVLAVGIYWGAHQYLANGAIETSANFGRRVVMHKGVSTAHFWDAFAEHPVMMRDSSLMRAFGLPQEQAKTTVAGALFLRSATENYDVNAWAAAFANFGYLGLPLVTLLILGILWFVDSQAERGNLPLLTLVAGLFGYIWGEQAFESSMLSSGVAVTMVLLLLLGSSPSDEGVVAGGSAR